MVIAITGPIKEDVESSYEFISVQNEFKFIDLEEVFSGLSDSDYEKFVLSNDEFVMDVIHEVEEEFGVCVVYGDSAFATNSVLDKIIKEDGMVIITAREDVSSYKEYEEYKAMSFDSLDAAEDEMYTRFVDLYERLSDINENRVFFNDTLSGDGVLYDVVDIIDGEEIEDSNDSEFDTIDYVEKIVALKKASTGKVKREKPVLPKKKIKVEEPVEDEEIEDEKPVPVKDKSPKKKTGFDSVIKNAMLELGMDNIVEETVAEDDTEDIAIEQEEIKREPVINTDNKEDDFPMNPPEEVKKPKKDTNKDSKKEFAQADIKRIAHGVTVVLPTGCKVGTAVIDGVEHTTLTMPLPFIPISPVILD